MTRYVHGDRGGHITKIHQENTPSKEYFWSHEWIPSLRLFPSTHRPHILFCKVLAYVYVCGPLPCCYFKCYENLQRKMTGVELLQGAHRSICAALFPSSHQVHFTLLKHAEKTTYWVTQTHLESNLRYYTDSRASDGVLPLNYTVSLMHYGTCCCVSVGRRRYRKGWHRHHDTSQGFVLQHSLGGQIIQKTGVQSYSQCRLWRFSESKACCF